MKKHNIFLAATLALSLVACKSESELDKVSAELTEKRSELAELKKEIKSLELKEDSLAGKKEDKRLTVVVSELLPQKFESFVKVYGTITSDNDVTVMPEGQGGIIRKINVHRGQNVSAGQVLAYYDSELISKQIKEQENNLAFATTMFEKQKSLYEQKATSEVSFLQAKNQKESLEKVIETLKASKSKSAITAPISGRIDELFANTGEMANPMSPFARIVNTSHAYIETEMSESFVNQVKMGDKVTVTFPGDEQVYASKVAYISNYINPNNRTFRIQVELPKTSQKVVPNMLTVVQFRNISYPQALVVNNTSINTDLNGDFVFVVEKEKDKSIAKKIGIVRGETYQNLTVIKQGLKPNQLLIENRYQNLDNGDEVIVKQ